MSLNSLQFYGRVVFEYDGSDAKLEVRLLDIRTANHEALTLNYEA